MRFVLLLAGLFMLTPAFALPKPTGPVLLTLTGAISETNSGQNAVLDRKTLESLPQYSFTTTTPWIHEAHKYTGFSAVDLLKLLGSKGTLLRVTALNKYVIDIPVKDFAEHGAIFATRKDGHKISVRDLGPVMVLYPFDDHPELQNETYYWRSIWQANTIEVLTSASKE